MDEYIQKEKEIQRETAEKIGREVFDREELYKIMIGYKSEGNETAWISRIYKDAEYDVLRIIIGAESVMVDSMETWKARFENRYESNLFYGESWLDRRIRENNERIQQEKQAIIKKEKEQKEKEEQEGNQLTLAEKLWSEVIGHNVQTNVDARYGVREMYTLNGKIVKKAKEYEQYEGNELRREEIKFEFIKIRQCDFAQDRWFKPSLLGWYHVVVR
jgi:hypothetical protein